MRALPRAVAVGCFVVATMTASAYAADSSAYAPPGGAALRQARAAWDGGDYATAEPLYREALERGGLSPADVLEGYVRLGAIRASLGKKDQAIAAFRAASILDASFAVPREAGTRGKALAARAKRDTAKLGSIQLSVKAPKEISSAKAFKVTASLDAAHLPIVAKIGLIARDGTSGKEATAEAKPDEVVEFEVPPEVTLPNASLLVRVDALDSHNNRLASAEERVRVGDGRAAGPVVAAVGGPSVAADSGKATPAPPPPGADAGVRQGGSFWSSPWPYVIGGIALAGAGTAVFFGTRPPDDVSVGQVGVRSR